MFKVQDRNLVGQGRRQYTVYRTHLSETPETGEAIQGLYFLIYIPIGARKTKTEVYGWQWVQSHSWEPV